MKKHGLAKFGQLIDNISAASFLISNMIAGNLLTGIYHLKVSGFLIM